MMSLHLYQHRFKCHFRIALPLVPLSCNLLPCYKPNPEHKNLKLLDVT